jgi:hypothetical protein
MDKKGDGPSYGSGRHALKVPTLRGLAVDFNSRSVAALSEATDWDILSMQAVSQLDA